MKNKGITLVALIVTIIILLILAGIAISQLTDSGLFGYAKLAKEKYENSVKKEDEMLSDLGNLQSSRDDSTDIEQLRQEIENLKKQIGGVPAGTVISYIAGTDAPSGYLKCDGTVYNIVDYKTLADTIKNGFGNYNYWGGDGTTTFAVPNLQGEFLRGYTPTKIASKSGVETTALGIHQDATMHTTLRTNGLNDTGGASIVFKKYWDSNDKNVDSQILSDSSNLGALYATDAGWGDTFPNSYTSRPTNTSVLYCIKY